MTLPPHSEKSLRSIFHSPEKGVAWKWPHYFRIYERHFERLRDRPIRMLEIGIYKGGSLWMWKEYFKRAEVVGIDIDSATKQYEGEGVTVRIGDQADRDFLTSVGREHGGFDIVLDDGGHQWGQQITSLVTLFEFVNDGGLYMIEDIQNSYSTKPIRRIRRRFRHFPFPPTAQFCKRLVDSMHLGTASRGASLGDSVASISFHPGVVVIEKGRVEVQDPIRSRQYRDPTTKEWVETEVDRDGNFVTR